MNKFKLQKGISKIYPISEKVYEDKTRKKPPYAQKGKDGETRFFAICPACDNPIQLIGMFKKERAESGKVYGKHYCRSVEGIASHNEAAYNACPLASHSYKKPDKHDKKAVFTDFEKEIYNIVRNHFDQIVFILRQDLGVYITKTMARRMLELYYGYDGWMYRWANIYNIPWVVMYFYEFDIYGKWITRESDFCKYLAGDKKYILKETQREKYLKVDTEVWVESSLMLRNHSRKRLEIEDDFEETVDMDFAVKKAGQWKTLWKKTLPISQTRFINLVNSEKSQKYRDKELIRIAHEIMPEYDR